MMEAKRPTRTKMKLSKFIFWLVALSGILVVLLFLSRGFPAKQKNVLIRCNYMAYACGDCMPQFRIKKIVNGKGLTKEILGRDIFLKFSNGAADARFYDSLGVCITCYDIDLQGQLVKNPFKEYQYTLVVSSYKLSLRNGCCTNDRNEKE